MSLAPAVPAWTRRDRFDYWCYRIGGYVLLHLLDEPAWLALLFC